MSFFPGKDPAAGDKFACEALELVIVPRSVDLDDFAVRRALPHSTRRTVGPYVFFDHFGPAEFRSGKGLDVRPHPHIGLSTLTYLYDGEIIHRDTLGVNAAIHPGEVNWMTAMMSKDEEIDPSFAHLGGNELPVVNGEGKTVRVVAGRMFGAASTLKTTSETIFADISLEAGAAMPLDADYEERAIYVSSGEIDISGDRFDTGRLLIFRPGDRVTVKAVKPSRIAVVGGAPLDGPRYVWWNFVSSRRDRIDQAKEEWKQGHFGKVPGDEIEFIPLPENRPYTAG
jgi:redox-sensitive bicupin YhaK (pirin superfamily)